MERLDQGPLHPLLNTLDKHVSDRNRTWVACVAGEQTSKELFEQLINSYSEHLHELATVS
jgi:hypothetical protein